MQQWQTRLSWLLSFESAAPSGRHPNAKIKHGGEAQSLMIACGHCPAQAHDPFAVSIAPGQVKARIRWWRFHALATIHQQGKEALEQLREQHRVVENPIGVLDAANDR